MTFKCLFSEFSLYDTENSQTSLLVPVRSANALRASRVNPQVPLQASLTGPFACPLACLARCQNYIWNLQGCCLLFSYQGSLFLLSCDSHIRLTQLFLFVNNFFNLFFADRFLSCHISNVSRDSLVRISYKVRNCQHYFYFFFNLDNSYNYVSVFRLPSAQFNNFISVRSDS